MVLIDADLGTQEGIAGFILALHEKAPGAQMLINNAGHLVTRAKMPEFTSDLWDEVMNLNAKSVYFIWQAAADRARRSTPPPKPPWPV